MRADFGAATHAGMGANGGALGDRAGLQMTERVYGPPAAITTPGPTPHGMDHAIAAQHRVMGEMHRGVSGG